MYSYGYSTAIMARGQKAHNAKHKYHSSFELNRSEVISLVKHHTFNREYIIILSIPWGVLNESHGWVRDKMPMNLFYFEKKVFTK